MIKNGKEQVEICEKKVIVPKIDINGNISYEYVKKAYIGVKKINIGTLKEESIQVSKDYLYLELIDDDTYIFEDYGIDAKIGCGILRIKRNKKGYVIPMKEEFVVDAIYDNISPNNDKTVTVNYEGNYTYFDYEKGIQLTPVVLKHAVPFNVGYEGFAECSTENKEGYLPRDAKPVTKEEDIKLLSEEQVKALVKYQGLIDNVYDYDSLYEDITGHSYRYRKKYDKNI